MKDSNEHLFVYGTLRRGVALTMQKKIAEQGEWMGEAHYRGKLFLVENHPAAIPSESDKDSIVGDLYDISGSFGLLQRLDHYERYNPDNPRTSLYIRKKVTVSLIESGNEYTSWIYIFNRPTNNTIKITSGDYLDFING